eukprot:Selendium_serpulae@DN6140_c2_g1_i12.p1
MSDENSGWGFLRTFLNWATSSDAPPPPHRRHGPGAMPPGRQMRSGPIRYVSDMGPPPLSSPHHPHHAPPRHVLHPTATVEDENDAQSQMRHMVMERLLQSVLQNVSMGGNMSGAAGEEGSMSSTGGVPLRMRGGNNVRLLESLQRLVEGNGGPAMDQSDACRMGYLVDQLPSTTFTENMEKNADEDNSQCMICFEEYAVGDVVRFLPCMHRFHTACVDPWLKERSKLCPICKKDVMSCFE